MQIPGNNSGSEIYAYFQNFHLDWNSILSYFTLIHEGGELSLGKSTGFACLVVFPCMPTAAAQEAALSRSDPAPNTAAALPSPFHAGGTCLCWLTKNTLIKYYCGAVVCVTAEHCAGRRCETSLV